VKCSKTRVAEKIETHILYPTTFFYESCAVYEIIGKNTVELGRPEMTIWCMSIAYWILKATNTLSEYVTLIALLFQQWLYECASVLHHIYVACLVLYTMILI